jgi:hypothetical protein
MRILICGGRDYTDLDRIYRALNRLEERLNFDLTVIHGDCPTGVDAAADVWALWAGYERVKFPVTREEWGRLGLRAGPLRNQRMIDEGHPDAVVAFPGARGTADMVRRARAAGLPVWIPYGGVAE